MNRRQFILLGTASIGAAFASSRVWQKVSSSQSFAKQPSNLVQLYQSRDGLLELNLEARENLVNLGEKQAYLLTYNGQVPAPRLEAKKGDRVRIHFTNSLSQPTNLHYHGLHLPPTGNADNVFLHIPPGERLTYEFDIAQNQVAGTFWYHPHLHGLVAEQLFSGLAGLFVVRGDVDEIPEIKAAKEEFVVLQDFALDNQGRLLNSAQMPIMIGREGDLISVNGQFNPNFFLAKGGLLRLRILNACTSRFYRLTLENHDLHLIAIDGGTLSEPIALQEILLTPGQRVDVLVRGDRDPGQYRLLNLPYNRGGMGMMGGGMMGGGMMGRRGNINRDQPMVLATVNYQNSVSPLPLPTQLTSVETLPEPQQVRQFQLNHGMSPGMGMAFLINGQPYNGDRIDTSVKLNTVEDWEITNTGVMDHPFHIHVNAFQIISRNGKPEPGTPWRDTVLVPRGEMVRIRMGFRDFTGKSVYHCHILDHEDLGMMGNLEISH